MAIPAHAARRPFVEHFDTLDPARWAPGDHRLGRGALAAANVAVAGGALALRLPAGTTDGAEVRSIATHRFGSFRARLQVADAPSSITGFFLYAPPDLAHEIDIEIFNDRSGTLLLTTYAGGRETHHERRRLGFDPTAAPHDYAIDRRPDAVAFAVDGRVLRRWTTALPSAPMNLYVNAWFPRWLGGVPPAQTRETVVHAIANRPR